MGVWCVVVVAVAIATTCRLLRFGFGKLST